MYWNSLKNYLAAHLVTLLVHWLKLCIKKEEIKQWENMELCVPEN
jgi:hypothetical protein